MHLKKAALDVVLVTQHLEAMTAFYTDCLGFPVAGRVSIPDTYDIVRLACGESVIRLCAPTAPLAMLAPEGGMLAASGMRALSFSVSGLGALFAGFEQACVRIQTPLRELRPGVFVAVIEDPDGNAIELQCQE